MEQKMASNEHHWVEDLFPPTYGLTLQDIVDGNSFLKPPDCSEADKEPSVFEKISQKISPLDTSAIKNVYERVWFMQNLEALQNGKSYDAMLTRTLPGDENKRDASTSTTDLLEHVDIHDSCVWTESEINVLRSVFKSAQCRNRELEAKLKAVDVEIDKMRQKSAALSKSLEEKTSDYAKAAQANGRLSISVKFLKVEKQKCEERISSQNKVIETSHQQRQDKVKEIQKLSKKFDALRIQNQRLETELSLAKKEELQEQLLREDNLKAAHEKHRSDLVTEINHLKKELKKEREDHAMTKKGLDHLRSHFSSLPSLTKVDMHNSVNKDQLTKWTY